jgi:dihydroneopterin aldolase
MAIIEIRDVRFTAIIGVLDEERHRAQPLSLDLDVERDVDSSRDTLDGTTNYAALIDLALAVVTDGQFQLLETAAARAASALLDSDPQLERVTAVVRKLRPPVPHDVAHVGVRVTVSR